MDLYEMSQSVVINLGENNLAQSVAFDGKHYYFTLTSQNKIYVTDDKFKIIKCYETIRKYDSICFDYKERCLWASCRKNYDKIYKLDMYMNEISSINISYCRGENSIITGISYNCCNDSLVISFSNNVMEISKGGEKIKDIYSICNGHISDVVSICPGYLVTVIKNNKQTIYIINKMGNVSECCCINGDGLISNIIFNPCNKINKKDSLEFFYVKNGCTLCMYREEITESELGYQICCCNYEICEKNNNHDCDCEKEKCNVIHSIALVETSISHILNAEGEKIQKVLKISNNIEDIIAVNREVNKTIMNITRLENALYDKLLIITEKDFCKNDCNHKYNEDIECNI